MLKLFHPHTKITVVKYLPLILFFSVRESLCYTIYTYVKG